MEMKLKNKIKIEGFREVEWIVEQKINLYNHQYFLIKPDKSKYNKMIVNADHSVVVMDIENNADKFKIIKILKKELKGE